MKRIVCFLLLLTLAAGLLTGCGQKAERAFQKTNEILTYQKIDEKKTQLVVSMIGNNANVGALAKAFMQDNPDVQVVCIDITGGNAAYRPIVDWVTHGMAPDAMFVNLDSFVENAVIEKYFVNLSANPVIDHFEMASLQNLAVNSNVYFLPAPTQIHCMIYNKTLFDKYGWTPPNTFDEFVALCLKIKEDTDGEVQPWNPNAKYDSSFTVATEAFTYAELFGGVDNRIWYNDFADGKATFAGHMERYYDVIQTLIDSGLLLPEHFTYSATTLGKEFREGKIAMINGPASIPDSEFEYAMMPFPTTSGSVGYVNEYYNALFCVPLKEHTKAEQDALDRFILFFGSEKGQSALIGDTLMVSKLKDMPASQSAALAGIEDALAQGHAFVRLDFPGAAAWTFRKDALAMTMGEKTGADCIAFIDAKQYADSAEATVTQKEKLATVEKDLTAWEFSCYIADMYRETAGADIGLINHGVAYRGNLVRLFAGNLYTDYVTVLKPRSFANKSTLVKVSMTGRQLLDALNNPPGSDGVSDSVYAYSGLKCEIAPWRALGSKYVSVKLADGSLIQPDKLYTVAFWQGTVAEEYVTETLQTYEGTWEDLMTAKLAADKTVAPVSDGRYKLIWD